MAAAKKTKNTNVQAPKASAQKPSVPVKTAAAIVEHPRVARAKRLGVYHLHTTKAGGVTQAVQEASEHAYKVMESERKDKLEKK